MQNRMVSGDTRKSWALQWCAVVQGTAMPCQVPTGSHEPLKHNIHKCGHQCGIISSSSCLLLFFQLGHTASYHLSYFRVTLLKNAIWTHVFLRRLVLNLKKIYIHNITSCVKLALHWIPQSLQLLSALAKNASIVFVFLRVCARGVFCKSKHFAPKKDFEMMWSLK